MRLVGERFSIAFKIVEEHGAKDEAGDRVLNLGHGNIPDRARRDQRAEAVGPFTTARLVVLEEERRATVAEQGSLFDEQFHDLGMRVEELQYCRHARAELGKRIRLRALYRINGTDQ